MTDHAALRRMMVDTQVRTSDVSRFPIIDAMMAVPREDFVPAARRATAYVGENIDLGGNRVILDPRTFAKMLDAVDIQPHDVVLDVGPGFGYSSAVIARLAEAVVAVEPDPAMATEAEQALAQWGADNAAVIEGAMEEGAPRHGPYDAILIQGAVEHLPDALIDQLKEGGRISCLFLEGALGVCRTGYKIDGQMSWRYAFNAGAPVLPGVEKRRAFVL